MNINIKIEDYLSEDEIKEIVTEEIKKHVRNCVGEVSVSQDKTRVMLSVMAKQIARDGIQGLIPNFKESLDEHIKEEIKNYNYMISLLIIWDGEVMVTN